MTDTLLNKISKHSNNTIITDAWLTGRTGEIVDIKGDCVFRFIDFISQFVKTFKRNSFDLDIIGEAYKPYGEYTVRTESPSLNVSFKFSKNRDDAFEEIAETWLENYFADSDSKISISSSRFNTLPHWRDLKFSCAGKELIIYPNGGILNGWEMADGGDEYMSLYSMCQCIEKGEEMFKLVRGEKSNDDEIMFDIELR